MKKKNILLLLACIMSLAGKSQKLVRTYYDYQHTKVKEEYSTDSYGNKTGVYKSYSEFGGVMVNGTYKNDKFIGKWVTKDEKGVLQMEENYDNDGEYNGQVLRYKNGYEYIQEGYKHGAKNGHWKEWFQDEGGWNVFLKPDGKTQVEHDYYFKNGLQDSIEIYYNQKGVLLSKINYKLGVKEGRATFYTHEGSGTIWMEGDFKNDTVIGKWKEMFDSQNQSAKLNKTDATYYRITDYGNWADRNNTIVKATDYYITGEKQSEETIGANGFIGQYIEYYKNGQVSKEGKYNIFQELSDGFVKNKITVSREDSVWDMFSISGKDSVKLKYVQGKLESSWSVFSK